MSFKCGNDLLVAISVIVHDEGNKMHGSGFKTPAGPTLRVFQYLRRKCCLFNDICKWIDFLVFSDKDEKP